MKPNDLPLCVWCDEPILDGERLAPDYPQPMHYECGLRAVIGSLGHQRGRCFCYGGTEEDPPELTRRQAARAAALYFHTRKDTDDDPPPAAGQPSRD